jgi:hypothetical protein
LRIVQVPLFAIRKNGIGLVDLFGFFFGLALPVGRGVREAIRMNLTDQTTVGGFDLRRRCGFRDFEE